MLTSNLSKNLVLLLPLVAVLLLACAPRSSSGYVMARILAPPDTTVLETSESAALSQPEEINGGDDEEPETATFVLSKKSATALNKLMIALRSFDKGSAERGPGGLDVGEAARLSPVVDTFSLQRRNQKDRKTYLRCYFNAVSCF